MKAVKIEFVSIAAVMVALQMNTLLPAQISELTVPEKEHQWLQQFVGEWDTDSEGSMGPDQPPMKSSGTTRTRMLGEIWIVSEIQVEMQGSKMHAVQTVGYDPVRKKYVGTWIDSMINHMWKYEGTVDAAGTRLTLEADGPDFVVANKTTRYRDAYEFKTKDHIVATSSLLTDDGKWVTFATGNYRRRTEKQN